MGGEPNGGVRWTVAIGAIACVILVMPACAKRDPSSLPGERVSAVKPAASGDGAKSGADPKEGPKQVAWEPSLLEGGYMFEDAQQFGAYVRRAEIIAMGVLTEWDGSKGRVRLESVLRGKLSDATVPVIATGGVVRPKPGERVLFLIAPRDGEFKLHSFCGASGMYDYTADLELVVIRSLRSNG